MKHVQWENKASSDRIPLELRPLVGQTVKTYQDRYGNDLVAVYINGSVVRGDWRRGNDIDVIGFVRSDEDADDSRLKQMLDGLDESVSPIDPLSITDGMRQRPSPRIQYRLMILALDGVRVWGEDIDLTDAVPADPVAFASRLYFDFKTAHAKYKTMDFDGSSEMLRRARRMTKMVVRLANGIAIIRGGSHCSAYEAMLANIQKWAPEWYEKAQEAYDLRYTDFSEGDYQTVLAILEELIVAAEKLGVAFLPPGTTTR